MKRFAMFGEPIDRARIETGPQRVSHKPAGFWYGCGPDWIHWVEDNNPEWMGEYVYEVTVDTRRMLLLETFEELCAFTKKYGVGLADVTTLIDWRKVVKGHDGIEICPHIDEARRRRYMDSLGWYWSWDVASGCIWNPNALLDYDRVTMEP